jgi:citrate lyase beta subunit
MRHFAHLPESDRRRLFAVAPCEFGRGADVATLAVALGATLYMPGSRPTLADDLDRTAARGGLSVVICLEDAVADGDVEAAQRNAVGQLRVFAERRHGAPDEGPLVFVRVRRPEQITGIVAQLGPAAGVLSGFVLPKFTDLTGVAFLDAIEEAATASGVRLLAMPVLESAEVIHRESRIEVLTAVRAVLDKRRDSVLAVRIGATDLCAAYGIRRGQEITIYDVRVVADAIADIVNVLGRADDSGHVVTGAVWEYFSQQQRLFKPRLRESLFSSREAAGLRRDMITSDTEGLLREVVLDKANGLTGKTVIHPSHVPAVHALMVVSAEEYADASDVVRADGRGGGGVCASSYHNKMNESKPHRAWAERTLRRATAFGVAADDVGVVDLLMAGRPA